MKYGLSTNQLFGGLPMPFTDNPSYSPQIHSYLDGQVFLPIPTYPITM
jgi:hypothetical protein